jgi:hypothetical protein
MFKSCVTQICMWLTQMESVKKKSKLTFSCDRKCIFLSVLMFVLRLTQMISVEGFKDRRYSLIPVRCTSLTLLSEMDKFNC